MKTLPVFAFVLILIVFTPSNNTFKLEQPEFAKVSFIDNGNNAVQIKNKNETVLPASKLKEGIVNDTRAENISSKNDTGFKSSHPETGFNQTYTKYTFGNGNRSDAGQYFLDNPIYGNSSFPNKVIEAKSTIKIAESPKVTSNETNHDNAQQNGYKYFPFNYDNLIKASLAAEKQQMIGSSKTAEKQKIYENSKIAEKQKMYENSKSAEKRKMDLNDKTAEKQKIDGNNKADQASSKPKPKACCSNFKNHWAKDLENVNMHRNNYKRIMSPESTTRNYMMDTIYNIIDGGDRKKLRTIDENDKFDDRRWDFQFQNHPNIIYKILKKVQNQMDDKPRSEPTSLLPTLLINIFGGLIRVFFEQHHVLN